MINVDVFTASGRNTTVGWYIRLWAATLRRAAVDFALYKDHPNIKRKKIGYEAHRWIFNEDASEEINSFEIVCTMLGLPAALIREKVLNLTEDEARRLRGMEFGDSLDK